MRSFADAGRARREKSKAMRMGCLTVVRLPVRIVGGPSGPKDR